MRYMLEQENAMLVHMAPIAFEKSKGG